MSLAHSLDVGRAMRRTHAHSELFAVFDVNRSLDRDQKERYFAPIYQQLNNGGLGAMLRGRS
ncbi:MAG: hypothetical protein WBV78_09845 [Roseobacter sp.]